MNTTMNTNADNQISDELRKKLFVNSKLGIIVVGMVSSLVYFFMFMISFLGFFLLIHKVTGTIEIYQYTVNIIFFASIILSFLFTIVKLYFFKNEIENNLFLLDSWKFFPVQYSAIERVIQLYQDEADNQLEKKIEEKRSLLARQDELKVELLGAKQAIQNFDNPGQNPYDKQISRIKEYVLILKKLK